jgi:hypothetical protein|tara:strand:- start:19855 stop:20169 length:315 start_codon:yes stop_codon:yes gene_type:complete
MVDNTKTVTLSVGEVTLEAPIARRRNKIMMESRVDGKLDEMLMMTRLLPQCITSHPFDRQNVKDAIEGLKCNEYDALINALTELLKPKDDLQKKLKPESDQEEP